jgi:signal transduction histidine kinase
VIDTGIGISPNGLKKLFIDFSKLDENSKRNSQGTGLGLSICKNIIEKMGGSVNV